MAVSRPLAVAGVAAALLLVVIGADVSMNRTIELELQRPDGSWARVGQFPPRDDHVAAPHFPVELDRNGTATFRLLVENGYPWALREPYEILLGDRVVAQGELDVAARETERVSFSAPAQQLYERHAYRPEPTGSQEHADVSMLIRIGDAEHYAFFGVRTGGSA